MAVTALTITPLGGELYRLDFASDLADPVFRIYRDGVLIDTTTETSYVVRLAAGESPVFEVLDTAAAPQPGYPADVTLAWYTGGATVASYRVEQLVDGVWTEVASVRESGKPFYTWRSGVLADSTSHQFKITPMGVNGNAGTATNFAVLIVRYPDVPSVSYAYNGAATPTVTITAA